MTILYLTVSSVQVTRVATYKELDTDFQKHAGLLSLVCLDLVSLDLIRRLIWKSVACPPDFHELILVDHMAKRSLAFHTFLSQGQVLF